MSTIDGDIRGLKSSQRKTLERTFRRRVSVDEVVGRGSVDEARRALLARKDEPEALLPIIVCGSNGSSVGLVVHQISDVVEEHVTAERQTDELGLVSVAVVGADVTQLVDTDQVVAAAGALAHRRPTDAGGLHVR